MAERDPEVDDSIAQRLQNLSADVEAACADAGRSASEVRVLLATKTVPAERIRVAIEAGYDLIGENRVQEVLAKHDDLVDLPHRSHFIGHLQRNKINQVLGKVDAIQSIDRLELAEAVSKRLSEDLDVYIQVNTSAEPSKYGVEPAEALGLVEAVSALPRLTVRGFMTIGLFSADESAVRRCYERLRVIRDEAFTSLPSAVELSMGMSGDYRWAIAEGATMIRVGTAVFGARSTSDSFYWPAHGSNS